MNEQELWERLRAAKVAKEKARSALELANTEYHLAIEAYDRAWNEHFAEVNRDANRVTSEVTERHG